MDDYKIALKAVLDAKASGDIQKELDALKDLRLRISKITLDSSIIKDLQKQLSEGGIDLKLVLGNTNQIINQAKQVGRQVGQNLNDGMSKGINDSKKLVDDFRKSLSNIGMGEDEINGVISRVKNLNVEITKLTQSTSKKDGKSLLNVNVEGIDKFGQAVKLAEQWDTVSKEVINSIDGISTAQQKASSSTDSFINKQKQAAAAAKNALSKIESSLHDKNANKTLANTDFNANGLKSQIDRVNAAILNLNSSTQTTFTDAKIKVDNEITALKNLITELKNAEYAATSLRTKDIGTIKIDEGNKLDAFIEKMKQSGHYTDEIKKDAEALKAALNNMGESGLTSWLNQFSNLESKFKSINASLTTQEKSVKLSTNIESERKMLTVYRDQLQEAGVLTGDVERKVQALFNSLSKVGTQTGLTTWRAELRGVKAELDAVVKSTQNVSNEKASSLINRINTFMTKNTRITREARTHLEGFVQELNRGVNLERWNQINAEFKQTENSMRGLHKLGMSFKNQFEQAAGTFTQWLSVSTLIMTGISKTREAVAELKEVDSILTEISKTSDITESQLKKLGDTSFESASKFGKKASDYLTGVQEMSRSGYYGSKGESMAEQSLLAQAAGDLSADVANKYILATNAAYKFNGAAEKINEVLDRQNMVTNRNSVSMEDMAVAMTEVGNVASSYRVSVEDLTAMIGTMESVTKSGGSEVGNAIKAILINVQNVTSKKIINTLKAANASMTEFVDGAEKLRNPIAILRDLSDTFSKLDKDDPLRAEILTNIGQKWNSNKLAALLENKDVFDKMLKDYSEGDGSALEEANKSANNLEGSLNKLGNTWTSTVNNVVNSDTLKTIVNGFNGVLTVVNTLTDKLGVFGAALVALPVVGLKGLLNITEALPKIQATAETVSKINIGYVDSDGTFDNKTLTSFTQALQGLNKVQVQTVLSTTTLNAAQKSQIMTELGLETTTKGLSTSFSLLGASIAASAKAFAMAFITSPAGWIMIATTAISLFKKFAPTLENARKKLEEVKQECEDTKSEISSIHDELKTVNDRLAELKKKGTLTFTEKEEYDNLKRQGNELQRQNDLLENQLKLKQQDKNKAFVETMDKEVSRRKTVGHRYAGSRQRGVGLRETMTTGEYIDEQFNLYKENLARIAELDEQYKDDLSNKQYIKDKKRLDEQNEKIKKYLSEKQSDFQKDADGIYYIQNPTTEIEKKANEHYNRIQDFLDRWAIATGGTNAKTNAFNRLNDTEFSDVTKELKELGKQGKVTADMLKNPKYDEFKQKLVDLGVIDSADDLDTLALAFNGVGIEAAKTGKTIKKVTVSLDDLSKASESIATLSKAFKEMYDDGYVTLDTLAKIQEATGLSGDEWESYQQRLLTAKKGSKEFNDILSELTLKMLDSAFAGKDMSTVTEAEVAALLRENGVVNANALAHKYLADAKNAARVVSAEEALALVNETTASETAQKAMAQFALKKIAVNNVKINTDSDIDNIIALANAAGASAKALAVLSKAKENANLVARVESQGGIVDTAIKARQYQARKVLEQIENGTFDFGYTNILDPNDYKVDYSGAISDKSKKSANNALKKKRDYAKKVADINEELAEKEEKFAEDMAKAWKEEHLEQLKDNLKEQENIINQYKKNLELLDFGKDLVEEDDFVSKSDLLTAKLDEVKRYGSAMRAEFDRVAKIIPKTGDEAQELASRLETLGSDMRSNITTLRETQAEYQKLGVEMMKSFSDNYMGELSDELERIEKQINILKADNADDYKYTQEILNMELLLPTYSSYDKQRKEKSRSDRALINAEQETQDKINEIVTTSLQMQAKENAEAREKERQNLIKDMEKARKDAKEKLDEAHQDYLDFLNQNKADTTAAMQEISDTIKNTNLDMPEIDTTKFDNDIQRIKDTWTDFRSWLNKNINLSISLTTDGINGGSMDGSSGNDIDTSGISSDKIKTVIETAKGQLGVPYVWGGTTPGKGLDCSALTQYAYGAAGVKIPRVSREQWASKIGQRVSRSNLQVGDQLFFATDSDRPGVVSHTGIYVGNNKMIHSPKTGDVVKISSIDNNYYRKAWIGAKRYAKGTPQGNAQSKGLGIAGENYKPEILIDKATGKKTYIDKPTVIDTDKTDVIGEKATAEIPKFASGKPLTNPDYLREIKAACDVFGVPYNIALSLIDQESSGGEDPSTWRANSAGAVGLTQITPPALGDFSKDAKVTPTPKYLQLFADNNVNWRNSRTTDPSAYRDNIWTGIGDLAYLKERYFKGDDKWWNKSLGRYYAGGGWDGEKGQRYAKSVINRANTEDFIKASMDMAEKFKTVSETVEEAAANPTSNTQATAAEQTAPQEIENPKIAEIAGFVEQISKDNEELKAAVRAKQFEIISDDSLTNVEKQQKLFNNYVPIGEDSARKASEAYKVLLLQYLDYYNKTQLGEEEYSQDVIDSYMDGLDKLKTYVNDFEDGVLSIRDNLTGIMNDELSKIDDYITMRNTYNDWGDFNDNEIKAIRRQLDIVRQFRDIDAISDKTYRELIDTYKQKSYTTGKNQFISAMEKAMSDHEKAIQRRIDLLEQEADKYNSMHTLLQSHYDVMNSISDAQYEINKELRASQAMYEYLNEDTRKLLFNQDDYNQLSSKLVDIQGQAVELQREYERAIKSATPENIAEITSQYQMQYDTLMKTYEIEKSELEVIKKKQQLNNVLKERNVSMFIDGRWQWVANTQDVINAQNELADAEHAKSQSETSLSQTNSLNSLQASQDIIGTQINELNASNEKYREQWENLQEQINGKQQDLAEVLKNMASSDCVELQNIIYSCGDSIKSLYENLTGQELDMPQPYLSYIDYTQSIIDLAKSGMGDVNQVKALNEQRNAKIDADGRPEDKMSDEEAVKLWQKWSDYADKTIESFNKMTTEMGTASSDVIMGLEDFHKALENQVTELEKLGNRLAKIALTYSTTVVKNNPTEKDRIRNYSVGKTKIGLFKTFNGKFADGTKNAPRGLNEIGEAGFEAYIDSHGYLTPISYPTMANMVGGEMVFNNRQLENLRAMWDISNMDGIVPQAVNNNTDNRIIINGMTVDTGSKSGQQLVSALQRYVAIH